MRQMGSRCAMMLAVGAMILGLQCSAAQAAGVAKTPADFGPRVCRSTPSVPALERDRYTVDLRRSREYHRSPSTLSGKITAA